MSAWWRRWFGGGEPSPLPERWTGQLRQIPHSAYVPPALWPRYEARVGTFLRQKRFIACGGLQLEDSQRLAVAALACLLILREPDGVYPPLRRVLLYPDVFLVPQTEPDELGLVDDAPQARIGESWQRDRVILSWADVEAALAGDATNVVAHEFAHQLDDETPELSGAPALPEYARWAEVMQREYQRLRRHRRLPVLDPYGAESPEEFFGVVCEAFFQQPQALLRHHHELYELLRDYFLLDPASRLLWPDAA